MTTWVLLRGLTREARHWGRFGKDLAVQLGNGHRVLALDLPGNGTLAGLSSPASVPAMAAACRAGLAQHGASPPYVLVAMSLGAMVALEWCQASGGELAGCVLINASVRGFNPFWERLQPRNYGRLGRLLLPGLPARARERLVLELTSAQPARHPEMPGRWEAIARHSPVTRLNALRQLLAAARYRAPGRPPSVPVLLLASAGDTLVSPRCSLQLALAWGLPLQMHPAAGHDLPLDAPQWVLQQIADWRGAIN